MQMAYSTFRRDIIKRSRTGPYIAILDQAIASASNFVPVIFIARCGTATELGIYSLIFIVSVFVAGIEHAVVTAPYTFYYDETTDGLPSYRGSVLVHHIVVVVVSSCVAAGICHFGSRQQLTHIALIAGITLGAILNREFTRRACFASGRFSVVLSSGRVRRRSSAQPFFALSCQARCEPEFDLVCDQCRDRTLCDFWTNARRKATLRTRFSADSGKAALVLWQMANR